VSVDGPVEVAGEAAVTGNVEAESLDLNGTLEGDATASGPIRVGARATATGTFRGTLVTIEPGARVALQLDNDFELDLGPARRGR
jgi:cytoskeletal protein CcmA (bactofilin family)